MRHVQYQTLSPMHLVFIKIKKHKKTKSCEHQWETIDAFFLHFGRRLFVFEIVLPWNAQLRSAVSRSDSLGHVLACFGHMAKTNNQQTGLWCVHSVLHHNFVIKALHKMCRSASCLSPLSNCATTMTRFLWELGLHRDWLKHPRSFSLDPSVRSKVHVTWSLRVVCIMFHHKCLKQMDQNL